MTEPRKNIKMRQETYYALKEEKQRMETWDTMFTRLLDEAKEGEE